MFNSVIAAFAGLALAATPVVATAQTGADTPASATAEVDGESFRGHLITLAGFAALILAVAVLFGEGEPVSP